MVQYSIVKHRILQTLLYIVAGDCLNNLLLKDVDPLVTSVIFDSANTVCWHTFQNCNGSTSIHPSIHLHTLILGWVAGASG